MQLAGLVTEQVVSFFMPNQHFPVLPHRRAAKLESAAEFNLASEPPEAREAHAVEAAEKVLRLDSYRKQAPDGDAE